MDNGVILDYIDCPAASSTEEGSGVAAGKDIRSGVPVRFVLTILLEVKIVDVLDIQALVHYVPESLSKGSNVPVVG